MSAGRTHERVAITAGVPLFALGVYTGALGLIGDSTDLMQFGFGLSYGAVMGWLITPDIDIPHKTIEEARWYEMWVPLGVFWETIWAPYSFLIPHRGVSHSHVIGTLTRVVYIAIVIRVLYYIFFGLATEVCSVSGVLCTDFLELGTVLNFIGSTLFFWGGMLVTWVIQDELHIFADNHGKKIKNAVSFLTKKAVPAFALLLMLVGAIYVALNY